MPIYSRIIGNGLKNYGKIPTLAMTTEPAKKSAFLHKPKYYTEKKPEKCQVNVASCLECPEDDCTYEGYY